MLSFEARFSAEQAIQSMDREPAAVKKAMNSVHQQLDARLFAAVSDEDRLFIGEQGRLTNVLSLLDEVANVNARNHLGETPLHKAARAGNGLVCLTLVGLGAEVETVDLAGERPIQSAAQRDQTHACLILMAASAVGRGLSAKGKETRRILGLPRLRAACELGDAGLVISALKRDTDPSTLHDRVRKAIAHAEARGKSEGPRILRSCMAAQAAHLALSELHRSQNSWMSPK